MALEGVGINLLLQFVGTDFKTAGLAKGWPDLMIYLVFISPLSYVKSSLVILENRSQFSREMAFALEKEDAVISALFAGAQASALPISLEKQIKNCIFAEHPQLKDDAGLNVQLSYYIHGGYYAYMENVHSIGSKRVMEQIDNIHAVAPIIIERCP